MGDAESNVQPSRKRAAGRELSRDNPGLDEGEGSSEEEMGTFKRASEEVLAGRRIVKVRRNQSSATPSAPSSNPFAGIRLVPPPNSGATTALFTAEADSGKSVADNEVKTVGSEEIDNKTDENENESGSRVNEPDTGTIAEKENNYNEEGPNKLEVADDKAGKVTSSENNIEKDDKENAEVKESENEGKKDDDNAGVDKSGEAASFSSFQQLSSSQNAFTGLVGTGFSSSTFSFGSLGSGSGSLFGSKVDSPSSGFGHSNNGSSSLFGSSGAPTITKSEGSGFPSMQEVPVETGEENEKPVFVADSVLFEYLGGSWKERGKGELKVNVSTSGTAKARLVMRTRGNYRLILNASLYPDMKLTDMEKRGVTFACVNSIGDGKDGLSTIALRFKDASIVDEFRACVTEHKVKNPVTLKTPENSPKASDE